MTSKLQEKPSALKRENPALQIWNLWTVFYFSGPFLPSSDQMANPDTVPGTSNLDPHHCLEDSQLHILTKCEYVSWVEIWSNHDLMWLMGYEWREVIMITLVPWVNVTDVSWVEIRKTHDHITWFNVTDMKPSVETRQNLDRQGWHNVTDVSWVEIRKNNDHIAWLNVTNLSWMEVLT